MDAVDRLLAIEEIRKLKARYFRSMDSKDWVGFTNVFTADARLDVTGEMPPGTDPSAGIVHGAETIAAFVKGAIDHVVTVHHGHMSEIEIVAEDEARGVWSMEDMLRWPPSADGSPTDMHGYGHYHETYKRVDGQWRIAALKLTRLRVDRS